MGTDGHQLSQRGLRKDTPPHSRVADRARAHRRLAPKSPRSQRPRSVRSEPAVLLVNLGTPDAPTEQALRPYLREFLTDRRVIETHPAIWRPILEGIILRTRPRKSAEKYRTIWKKQGSPLLLYTEDQAKYVAKRLKGQARVRFAMRYGSHSVGQAMTELYRQGYRNLLVVPLYPQHSQTTTGTALDEVYRWGLDSRDQFALRTVRSYADNPGYIEALAAAVEGVWEDEGAPNFAAGDRLVISYHGIPMAIVEGGDPYAAECEATTKALVERLSLPAGAAITAYQSKFGPADWTGPATIEEMVRLGSERVRADVICPGFVSDCLETLEEIEMENREAFEAAGGTGFNYIPWGNDRGPWLEALADLVEQNLEGWIDQ